MSTYGHPPIPDPCPEAHHAQRAHDDFHALLAWASECPDPEDVADDANTYVRWLLACPQEGLDGSVLMSVRGDYRRAAPPPPAIQ